jgi:DMSO/TMAO reductase YedYZ molybdopterin-dependent catalytic subunit
MDGHTGMIAFERSLNLDDARGSEALLAYAMNGEALPASQQCAISWRPVSVCHGCA